MSVPTRLLVFAPLIIAAVGAVGWLTAESVDEKRTTVTAAAPTPVPVQPLADPEAPSQLVMAPDNHPVPEHPPASLVGTSVPTGWAQLDSTDALIPTPALRQLFEYYLSALGEESLPQLVARIRRTLASLPEPAQTQAIAKLGAYLDYKLAVSDLEAGYGVTEALEPEELQRRMAEIHALRRTWLDSATAEAFFAEDEVIDRFQLEKLRIARADDLTETERQQALDRAESALPEPLRQARQDTRRFAEYERARQDLANDPQALNAWRQQAFGAEAAQRLDALAQEQEDWDRRWQAYSRERQALLGGGLVGPELAAAMASLRGRHFDEREQVRVQALDSIR